MALTIYRHLRISFMLLWVVVWNALLGTGLFLDRQAGYEHGIFFSALFGVAALGTSCLCALVLYVPRMQALALRAGATVADVRRDLWFLALLSGALGVASSVGFFMGASMSNLSVNTDAHGRPLPSVAPGRVRRLRLR
jgi:hypothetical protein